MNTICKLNRDILSYIVKIVKATKKENVVIKDNTIYAMDYYYNTLSVAQCYEYESFLPDTFSTTLTSLNYILNSILKEDMNPIIYLCEHNGMKCLYYTQTETCIFDDTKILNTISDAYIRTVVSKSKEPIYSNNLIKDNEEFNRALSIKAKDGATLCKISDGQKNYIMSVFTTIHPITKSDKVTMNIYDEGKTFLSECIIDKKKYIIYEYIRYLYI